MELTQPSFIVCEHKGMLALSCIFLYYIWFFSHVCIDGCMKTIACCTWSVDAPELWQACHSSIVTDGVLCRRFIGPLIQCLIKASRSVTDSTEVDQTCWEKHQNIFLVTDLWSYSLHQSWTWPKRLVRINWNCIGYQFRLCNLCRTMYDWNWCWLNTCNTYFVSNSLQQSNWLIIMTCVSGNCCNTSTCTDNARFCRRCLASMLARASSSGNLAVWGWSCGDANGHERKSQGFFTCYWTFWLLEISNIVNLSRSPETEAKIVTCRSGRAFMKCSRTCFHVFRPFQLCKVLAFLHAASMKRLASRCATLRHVNRQAWFILVHNGNINCASQWGLPWFSWWNCLSESAWVFGRGPRWPPCI